VGRNMTTVVYDGTTLATDSQNTGRGKTEHHCPKCTTNLYTTHSFRNKVRNPHGGKSITFHGEPIVAWASAGDLPLIKAIDTAISNHIDVHIAVSLISTSAGSHPRYQAGCSTIIVGVSKVWKIKIDGRVCKVEEVTEFPVIIGSGSSAARVAIKRLGLTAVGAVGVAIDSDNGTGGEINYIDCTAPDSKVLHYMWTEADTVELFSDILK
jgi:hypothetical protein